MSIEEIIPQLLYGSAIFGAFVSKTEIGKIKWLLWSITILLAHIADKVTQ